MHPRAHEDTALLVMTRPGTAAFALVLSAMLHFSLAWLTSDIFFTHPTAPSFRNPEYIEFGYLDPQTTATSGPAPGVSPPPPDVPRAVAPGPPAAVGRILKPGPSRSGRMRSLLHKTSTAFEPPIATQDAGSLDSQPSDAGAAKSRIQDGSILEEDASGPAVGYRDSTRGPLRDSGTAQSPVQDGSARDAGSVQGATRPDDLPSADALRGHVSLKLDSTAIRNSAHATLLREVVARLPDVRALLDGSGVDVVEDLDRLWSGTPDLSRERVAVVGAHRRPPDFAQLAAERLARAAGQTILFRHQGKVRTTRWLSSDTTQRTLALLGKRHFVISRDTDLDALIRMVLHPKAAINQAPTTEPADDLRLLALDPGSLVEAQMEGVRHYVIAKDPDRLPLRVKVHVKDGSRGEVLVKAIAEFGNPELAGRAKAMVRHELDVYARQPLIALFGLSRVLRRATLDVRDSKLALRIELEHGRAQSLLASIRDTMPALP